MDDLIRDLEMQKLSAGRKEALTAMLNESKGALSNFIGNVSGKNLKSAQGAADKASRMAKNRPKVNKGTSSEKARKRKMVAKQEKAVADTTSALKDAEKSTTRARRQAAVGAGVVGLAGAAGLAKALKRGSKASPMLSKKDKLISGLKKTVKENKKALAIGGGATAGAAGLAALLKK